MKSLTPEEYLLKKNFLKQRQSLPLHLKIEMSKRRIQEFYEHFDGKVYVSFSGGKDSSVLLHLVRSLYPEVPAVFVDTGLEYPEARKFIKSFDNVIVIRPEITFKEVLEQYGYPVISKEVAGFIEDNRKHPDGYTAKKFDSNSEYIKKYGSRYDMSKWKPLRDSDFKISSKCCKVMKKRPAHKFEKESGLKPFIATMAAESNLRKTEYLKKGCNSFNTKRPASTPLGFWTEQDIFQYLVENNLPYCSVYGEIKQDENGKYYTTKAKRTGCMFCMFGVHVEKSPNRFEVMKETHPKLYDYCINQLGCGRVLDFIGVKY
ncbi:phosphoadenosine phosphosulfate reductase family protein [bacterium]|nr:phosphoadenosine phosphosulfate reductase family protein [bacterium]